MYTGPDRLPVPFCDIEDISGMNGAGHQRTPNFPNKACRTNVSMAGFLAHEKAARTRDMS